MADKNCDECDGTGWMEDWSTSCGDPACCSPALMACPVCNRAGDNPTESNRYEVTP